MKTLKNLFFGILLFIAAVIALAYAFNYQHLFNAIALTYLKGETSATIDDGVDYFVNDKFFLNVDIKKLYLKTDVDVDLGLPATVPAEVKINPLLIGFGVGMKF